MSVATVKGVYDEVLATAILVPFGKMAELMLLVRVEELFEEDRGKLEEKLGTVNEELVLSGPSHPENIPFDNISKSSRRAMAFLSLNCSV